MKKFCLFVLCSVTFGCVSGLAHASDYDATHPPLTFGAFKPLAKSCECTKGEPCTCGDKCTCNEAVGCGKRAAARQAARAGAVVAMDEATYSVGFEPQQMAILQPVQAVQQLQVASADADTCPCCGMKMTPEQKAFMKSKQSAPVAPVQAAPVYTSQPIYTSAPVMQGYYGGACVGGSCGVQRGFIFRR